MLHPILAQKKIFYAFLSGWIILFFAHAGFLFKHLNLPLQSAFIDAIIYNFILMILALALYFPMAYPEDCTIKYGVTKTFVYHFFHHVITAAVTLILWLGASFMILQSVLGQDESYMIFARSSLPFRATIGGLILILLISMYHFIGFYKHLEEKATHEEQLKKMVKEAELKALKAQLNPHFLFNSLNSISSLTISDPKGAREMLTQLSDFLRYSLRKNDDSLLPLSEEIKNMRRYLGIEKVRFGNRLVCEFELPHECLDINIPAMLLQPVYENAIKHGLYESVDPITLKTCCTVFNDHLEISITNNYDPDSTPARGEGVGLENVKNKLFLFYNRRDLLTIYRENNHFEVKFLIPKEIKS
jgi:two-component system LytT family sensor kinase